MARQLLLATALTLLLSVPAIADTHYVWTNSLASAPPYTNWQTAAHVIQDAIDVASSNDTVLVTNGVYAPVTDSKGLILMSVNGPDLTTVDGGGGSRCMTLATGSRVTGFTLTRGNASDGGGAYGGTLDNCILTNNSASYGGGVYYGTLSSCTLAGNSASVRGGGSYSSTLNDCILTGNSATFLGGGASYGTLNRCLLTGNSAGNGGGTYLATLSRCVLLRNSAGGSGGAHRSTLNNCLLTGNSARGVGGGSQSSTLNNCTLTGNSARTGGGSRLDTLNNCIVYFNSAGSGANYEDSTFAYSCTTPAPAGIGNIDSEPLLASSTHLSTGSPCRGAGHSGYAAGRDIDGEAWLTPPSMGCDELNAGSITGALSVSVVAAYTNVAAGTIVDFYADTDGHATASVWQWPDGSATSNRPYASYTFATSGVHSVKLVVYNDSHSQGVTGTVTVTVADRMIRYVAISNATPSFPYASWETAATNIQDAIDAATQIGALVLVSNGVYETGERVDTAGMTNRVVIAEGITVESVHGSGVTVIRGGGTPVDAAVRCVYVGDSAVLSGFTLANGAATSGGGAWCAPSAVVNHCALTGNSAVSGGGSYGGTLNNCTFRGNSARSGGGSASSTLNNCALIGNSASYRGGGSSGGTLNNCTLTGNFANSGGGSSGGVLNNCIVYYNKSSSGDNYSGGTFAYSCTTPAPAGAGNIEFEPLLASATHLSTESPCRGAGNSVFVSGKDIDGEGWLAPPSMGCDELIAGASTGSLTVIARALYTNVVAGFPIEFVADIEGRTTGSVWYWGDGGGATNLPYASHAFLSNGAYRVDLVAYNDSYPDGVTGSVTVTVSDPDFYYVSISNETPAYPYTSWDTAATNIQDAIDATTRVGDYVRVSNGVYETGGRVVAGEMSNRVVITAGLIVESVNGAEKTVIKGAGPVGDAAVRCAYVGDGAVLCGFTLANGATRISGDTITAQSGGGAWCETSAVISNCTVTGNAANSSGGGVCFGTLYDCEVIGNSAVNGGGSYFGTLNHCTLTSNSAVRIGGGAYNSTLNYSTLTGNSATKSGDSYGGGSNGGTLNHCILSGNTSQNRGGGTAGGTLNNCILTGNSATYSGGGMDMGTLNNCTLAGNDSPRGGGVYAPTLPNGFSYATLNNCIVYYNTGNSGANYEGSVKFTYSCTTPYPGGTGCISDAPSFVDQDAGDYRLSGISPCIDAGQNSDSLPSATDVAGNSRIFNGMIDMGAYEFTMTTIPRLYLQGAYRPEADLMTTNLYVQDLVPADSSYAADAQSLDQIPSNVCDWVLFELVDTNQEDVVAASAVFLQSTGDVINTVGAVGVRLEASPGAYYLVAKHRNHVTVMSRDPIAYTNALISYDFTTGPDKYYGGTNACVQISSNLWGMIPGDADADGRVTWVDRAIVSNALGQTGYLQADINLDGVVTVDDMP